MMKKTLQTIKKHKRFLISTHVNPDPDALCSELAIYDYLRSLGKHVVIVNETKVPERFMFLPGIQRIKSRKDKMHTDFDVMIVVDCGDLSRVGKVAELLNEEKIVINIDHHITNDNFGNINLIKPQASSTAEVIYDLLKEVKYRFHDHLAMYLYIGIMTDTGSFRYENTTRRTHMAVGDLMRYKFSPTRLYSKIYETIPLKDMKAFTKVISRLDVLSRGRVIVVELNKHLVSQFSERFDLRDAIFKFLRAIEGAEVFVILTEITRQQTRVNLRSSGNYNVARLAGTFKGGGHRRASGCTLDTNIKETRRKVLSQIRKTL